ncbi:MAG: urease accessory protein UreD [Ferruginibacter sp.]
MIAKLHIQASLRNGITYLNKSYFTPPFKVANITEDKKLNKLDLMLMCSSPGILDEDDYELKIDVDANCTMQLHTQSYQRLFKMKKGAEQLMEMHLKKGSSFVYLPHPSVPHGESIFTAKNNIYLSDGCTLTWGEILTCGRKLNGEIFQFSKYHNITQIYLNNKLIIKENLLMQPSLIDVNGLGQLSGYTHQATLIYLDENTDTKNLIEATTAYLSEQNEIIFGITTAPINGIIIRLLGQKAEQLHNCLKEVSSNISLFTIPHSPIES